MDVGDQITLIVEDSNELGSAEVTYVADHAWLQVRVVLRESKRSFSTFVHPDEEGTRWIRGGDEAARAQLILLRSAR